MIPRETTPSISCAMIKPKWGWAPMSRVTGPNRKQMPGPEAAKAEDTSALGPRHLQCVHRWIEIQASRRPESIALATSSGSVSYGELNARANRLARRLRALGVGPEVPVGLCAGRT